MSDLVFKCPECANRLAVDVATSGQTMACLACGKSITVPRPTVAFACAQCQAELCAPLALVKATIACPSCGANVVVPTKSSRVHPARPPAGTVVPPVPSQAPAGESSAAQAAPASPAPASEPPLAPMLQAPAAEQVCRHCGAALPSAAIVCGRCKTNQLTGLKFGATRPIWLWGRRAVAALPSGLLLILLAVGGWFGWQEWQASKQEKQGLAAQAERDRVVAAAIARLRAETGPNLPVLLGILQTLDGLQRKPNERWANTRLTEYAQYLGEDDNGRPVRAGLTLLCGLIQLSAYDRQRGMATCALVQSNYSDTVFAALADTNVFFKVCAKCGGMGAYRSLHIPFTDYVPTRCGICQGSGMAVSLVDIKTHCNLTIDRLLERLHTVVGSGMDLVFGKPKVTPREWERSFGDTNQVALVDGLVRLSGAQPGLRLAIDPDAMPLLGGVRIKATDLAGLTNAATLGVYLYGVQRTLIARECPIAETDSNRVCLVTTESIWAYAMACHALAQNQTNRAFQVLHEATLDNSEFGQHARNVRQWLRDVHDRQAELSTWADRAGSSIGRQADVRRAVAEALSGLLQTNLLARALLAQRLDADQDGQFVTEAAFELASVLDQAQVVRTIAANLKAGTQAPAAARVGGQDDGGVRNRGEDALLESWSRQLQRLQESARASVQGLNAAHFETATNDSQVAENARRAAAALIRDRGNVMARGALGYWLVRQASLAGCSASPQPVPLAALIRACRADQKAGLLRAALDLCGQAAVVPPASLRRVGAVEWLGLDLEAGGGERVSLAVRFSPGRASGGRMAADSGIFQLPLVDGSNSTVRALARFRTLPLAYAGQDVRETAWQVAACDVDVWLEHFGGARLADQTLHVTVGVPTVQVSADSAGFATALAACSAMMNLPLRADLVLAGALQTNGTVRAVPGVGERLRAAVAAPGIEIVLLPSGNEPDLLLETPDTLCRSTVVLVDDALSALRFATSTSYQRAALAKLHQAQALILTGDWDKAKPLLLDVASEAPEIYNARRLLAWMTCWHPPSAAASPRRISE